MKTALLILILLSTGCATVPKNPSFHINKGEKIGILVSIPENLIHTHVGTTIFNNFVKQHPYQWQLESHMVTQLSENLEGAGYTVINLNKSNISITDIKNMVVAKKEQWAVNPKYDKTYNTLKKLGIKSVIYVNSERAIAYFQCGMSSCTDFYTDSYGLFTRSFLGIKSYFAVAAFDTSVLITDPLAKFQLNESRAIALKNYTKPAEFKNLSESEWQPIKSKIIKYLDDVASKAPEFLINDNKAIK